MTKTMVKPNYGENEKFFYMDTDGFIVYAKTDDIYKEFTENNETKFNTKNVVLDRSLPTRK